MSPTIGLPPPPAERCLETLRKSRYRGGTVVAEDVHDLGEHERRLADPDRYRPVPCGRCGGEAVHVHTRPERHPRGEPSLPPAVAILQFRCAECGATWRILPLFLARHLWHAWKAVERAVVLGSSLAAASTRPVPARTRQRWWIRLASSARALVVVLAASGGAALEEVAKRVGLLGTRAELVDAHAAAAAPPQGEQLASLEALVHRNPSATDALPREAHTGYGEATMGKKRSVVRCWGRWGEREAREALTELSSSGESAASFARRRGISTQRLAYWKKRLAAGTGPKFVAVALPAAMSAAWIEIAAGRVVVRIREQLDVDHVARLVEAIGRRVGDAC